VCNPWIGVLLHLLVLGRIEATSRYRFATLLFLLDILKHLVTLIIFLHDFIVLLRATSIVEFLFQFFDSLLQFALSLNFLD